MANQDVKRREFLKKGIGLASVSFIPFELDSHSKKIKIKCNMAEKILMRYGAEFGHVKPEIGKRNHGHI